MQNNNAEYACAVKNDVWVHVHTVPICSVPKIGVSSFKCGKDIIKANNKMEAVFYRQKKRKKY